MKNRVVLRLRGRMLEKFVSQAVRDGVIFGTVERISADEMRFGATEAQAKRIIGLAEEYRMDLTVLREEGWPLWKKRLRSRWSLAPGLLAGLLLLVLFTARIWRVEAISLDGMADGGMLAAIEEYVQEQGAKPGTERRQIDKEALQAGVYERWPELTHVNIRLDGVFLRVEVAVEAPAPEVYDAAAHRDLVAARDAVIVYVEPLAGQAAVSPGDTVRRGQVLIRGEERVDEENTRGIRALGSVIGRVWFTETAKLPLNETVAERTGRKSVSSELRLGTWKWKLSAGEAYETCEWQEEAIPVGGLYLPLRLVTVTRWETELRSVGRNREALLAEGEAQALAGARSALPENARETACWTECAEADGMLIVRATVEAQMDIAADRSLLIQTEIE